jgi:hypothetical protein
MAPSTLSGPRTIGRSRAADVVANNLKKWAWEVGAFFQGVGADAPDEDLRRIAPLHPLFRISRRP